MKSTVVFVTTLLIAASAQAVVINCVSEGGGIVRMDYSAADEKVLPIAFALDVSADSGATITKVYDYKVGESNAASPGFGFFPGSIKFDPNDGSIIDWGTPVAGGLGTSNVTLAMASRYNDKKDAPLVKGTLCRIQLNSNGAGSVKVTVAPNAAGGGVVLENATVAKLNAPGTIIGIRVDKCTVTAGSKPSSDSISVSGSLDAGADQFVTGNSITVTVSSDELVNPCMQMFPIDANTYKNGKYKCTQTVTPLKTSFAFDTKTGKFSFTAKNLSLRGLYCPVTIEVNVGSFTGKGSIDEATVNGASKPIPIKLMMGVEDTLRIDKVTVKRSTKANSDQFTIKGGFAVANTNTDMTVNPLTVTLGSQTFTIPAGSFNAGKSKFTCSKAGVTEGGVAAASFDFGKGTFSLTIKNTKIAAGAGSIGLRFTFASFNEIQQVTIP
jgi:hypothetical protein